MDEKYIQDLYNQLGGEAKFGAFNDFKDLMQNDDSYRKSFHSAFGEKTLGGFSDFESLVKKGGEVAPTVTTTTEATDESIPAVAPTPTVAPSQPYKSVYPFEISEEQKRQAILDPNNNYSDVPYGQKAPEFHLETIKNLF